MSVQHWKFQRLSAIVLIPIVLYSLFYIVNMGAVSYDILIDDKAFNYNENWIQKL